MTIATRVGTVGVALVLIMSVAGCVATKPTSSTTEITAPVSSDVASSAPQARGQENWTISYEGVGPLTIGGSLSTETAEVGAPYTQQPADYCQFSKPTVFLSSHDATVWVRSEYDNGVASDSIAEIAIGLEPAGRPLPTASPRTAEGIGVGSTEAALKAAYPGIEYDSSPFAGATHYLLTDGVPLPDGTQRYLLFVVKSGVVDGIVVQRHTQYLYNYCEDQG